MTETKHRGNHAEGLAVTWLKSNGFTIEARNVSFKVGEIDIIAKEGEILVFIEVRSRQSTNYGDPAATVDLKKQTHIIKAAQTYLKRFYRVLPFCRFDVVTVVGYGQDSKITLIRNAFQLSISPRSRSRGPWQAY